MIRSSPTWLLPAAALSAALTIAADWAGIGALHFVLKPLTTLLIITWAWSRGGDAPARQRWVRIGLVWSLVGDVALLWPQQGFLPGLVSFLLAHLAYIVAFTRGLRFAARPLPFVAYALVAGAILSVLWPGVPPALRGPVLAYVAALACMAAQAGAWWLAARGGPDEPWARRAALGGVLFMASDATLAVNRFLSPVPASGLWILATYWAAQAAITGSLRSGTNSLKE
ncbi:MAG TPA: lysoplasmalogenase [Ideonella sp.]|jgi:uncharacterized membrane protein YhhN|nr:lysoplasmalogenase [Ideonella sp.]